MYEFLGVSIDLLLTAPEMRGVERRVGFVCEEF